MILASTAALSSNRRKFEGYVPVRVSETKVQTSR